jgi:predicted nucleotidyltransferase component of viral defense system
MLHYKTVEPDTRSLLNKLMSMPELSKFYLVGGTALSLQYGHRISIDLDLFCFEKFDNNEILSALPQKFGKSLQYEGGFSRFGIFCFIDNVKVDLVHYPHAIIYDTIIEEAIRMYSNKEIAAMKIQAILGRGKKKDFYDIAELFKDYSVKDVIDFHDKKYPSQQLLISIPQALTYFAEADDSEDPISLNGDTWEFVKEVINLKVQEFLQ